MFDALTLIKCGIGQSAKKLYGALAAVDVWYNIYISGKIAVDRTERCSGHPIAPSGINMRRSSCGFPEEIVSTKARAR